MKSLILFVSMLLIFISCESQDDTLRQEKIKKAVLALQSSKRQRYGANPLAGKRSSAHYHGKRHYRFTMMNREMARISRIHGKVGYLAFLRTF